MIGLYTLGRICQQTITLITVFNVLQQGGLGLCIGRTEVGSTLEHQMFQIMGQTCGLGRVILRTCPHSDIRLNTRLLTIDGEIHLQSVVQRINTGFSQIALYALVLILLRLRPNAQHHASCHYQELQFHYSIFLNLISNT